MYCDYCVGPKGHPRALGFVSPLLPGRHVRPACYLHEALIDAQDGGGLSLPMEKFHRRWLATGKQEPQDS